MKHYNLFVCVWRCAASSPNAPICCAADLFGVISLLRSKIWYASFRYVLLLSVYFFFILETNRLRAIPTSTWSRQVRADDWRKKPAGARRSAAGSPDPQLFIVMGRNSATWRCHHFWMPSEAHVHLHLVSTLSGRKSGRKLPSPPNAARLCTL